MIHRDPARRALLAVRCPHCRAAVGARCVVPSNGRALPSGVSHQARVDARAVALGKQLRGAS